MLGFLITRLEFFPFEIFSECEVVMLVSLLIVGCCSILASLALAVLSILPSLNSSDTASKIYFGHIAQKSKDSFIKKINENTDNYSFDEDLEAQIYINSKIAWKNYKYIYWAIISGLVGIVAEMIFIGIALFIGGRLTLSSGSRDKSWSLNWLATVAYAEKKSLVPQIPHIPGLFEGYIT